MTTAGRRTGTWAVDALLVVGVLLAAGGWLREWSTYPAARYLYSVAIVDDGTSVLDPYRASLGIDYAEVGGHVYSHVAPYQPLLGVGPYAAYRVGGGDSFPVGVPAGAVGSRADIGMWLVTLVTSALPTALLVVLIRRYVARTSPDVAILVSLGLVWGTVVLPVGSMLMGHGLAACTGFAAWTIVRRTRPSTGALVGAGALLGASIGAEYTQAMVVAVVGIVALVAHRWRGLAVAVGGVLGLLPLFAINARTFGGPFTTAYQGHLSGSFQGSGAFGVYNLVAPQPYELLITLVGDRGIFTATPVLLVAVVGAVLAVRRSGPVRTDAAVALLLLALFLLATTGISGYGGSSPGPRYLVPIIPFFALPLARAWRRQPVLAGGLAAFGAVWMVLALTTDVFYQDGGVAPLDWLADLLALRLERSVLTPTVGSVGTLLLVALGVGATAAAVKLDRSERRRNPHRQRTKGADRVPSAVDLDAAEAHQ